MRFHRYGSTRRKNVFGPPAPMVTTFCPAAALTARVDAVHVTRSALSSSIQPVEGAGHAMVIWTGAAV